MLIWLTFKCTVAGQLCNIKGEEENSPCSLFQSLPKENKTVSLLFDQEENCIKAYGNNQSTKQGKHAPVEEE